MNFRIFTDSSANIPGELLSTWDIGVISLSMTINGEEVNCGDDTFDAEGLYRRMREEPELKIKTSMINAHMFNECFEPCLEAGEDLIYIGMSSGISGTFAAAEGVCEALSKKYPERRCYACDTRAASLGEGLLVLEAAELRAGGADIEAVRDYVNAQKIDVREHFLVDDLMFLKRGGRISGGAALVGTLLSVKPIMKGDEIGRIVLDRKIVGRKKAIKALADIFDDYAYLPHEGTIGIAHGGCEADAIALKTVIEQRHGPHKFLIVCYEPGTGSHVGPGTVALFFRGAERAKETLPVREKLAADADALRDALQNRLHKH